VQPACVIVEDGRISALAAHSSPPPDALLKDFNTDFVMPGLFDTHIHINEPGRADWEGFETATRAAAAGGYTCLVDMPLNSIPATSNVSALEQKRAAARGKALVDYAFWGGAVAGNAMDLKPLADAGVAGFKAFLVPSGVGEFSMLDEAGLRVAMPIIAASGLPFLLHAELPGPIKSASGDPRQYFNYLDSRPDEAELQAIRLIIKLVREYRGRVHIVHLATSHALPELRQARAEGLPITVETCPHYLYFSAESIPDGATQFKCAPPIRAEFHRNQLWQALRDGDIDMIATDHSPCPVELKQLATGNFQTAWGGIASVSLALSAIWTKARLFEISISEIVKWMCEQPAVLAGLSGRKGRLTVGADADITIFDSERIWHVTESQLHFRNKISPYLGEHLTGQVKATFVRGEIVYEDGRFPAMPAGRECRVGTT
jgi:allantoinase